MVSGLGDGEHVTILLADAVAALRFEVGTEPRVITAAALDFSEGFKTITTVNALESGLHHGMTSTELIEYGVLVPFGSANLDLAQKLF